MRRCFPAAFAVLAMAPPSSPAAPAREETARPAVTRITVAASGDLLVHQPVWSQALRYGAGRYDFRPMLRAIRPIVRAADVALCHAETPLVPGAPSGYPLFRTPPALARAVRWAGYDACSTASNHSLDAGRAGIASTARSFARFGVGHTGSARSAADRRRIATVAAPGGARVALLSYTETTNGLRAPHPWSVNLASGRLIARDARRARRAGADVVIVNVHWGSEYQRAPSAFQRRLARRLAGVRAITAIVGQHAHVVQPIRRVRGKVVVFGEGNLLSNQTAACCPAETQDGIIALLGIEIPATGRARVDTVRYVPTWVRHPDFTILPVRRALRGGWADRALLRASYRRTRAAVGRDVARAAAP